MKVCLLGLDGLSFDIIGRWLENGKLPNLERLMKGGSYGKLRSTVPPLTPPAWVSIVTGSCPEKHGIYDFFTMSKPKRLVVPSDRQIPAIWNRLEENGKSSLVLNAPITYPPEEVNGAMISGFPLPGDANDFAFPPSTLDRIPPEFPLVHKQANLETHLSQIRALEELTLDMIEEFEWDFLMTVVMNTDWVLHEYPELSKESVLEVYKKADDFLGRLMDRVPQETYVVVVSDHGFRLSSSPRKTFFVNNWLEEKGFLRCVERNSLGSLAGAAYKNKLLNPLIRYIVEKTSSEFSQGGDLTLNPEDKIDTEASNAVTSMGSHAVGYIGIDILEKDKYYAAVKEGLKRELGKVSDNNRSLVDKIWDCSKSYGREDWKQEKREGPDLIVKLRDGYSASLSLDPLGRIIDYPISSEVHGGHKRDGVFAMKGKGIKKGKKISEASVLDIAPTVYEMLGVPIPDNLDGRVLDEAVKGN